MVDKASPGVLIHGDVNFAIEFLQQEAFEDAEANEKVENEYDANDQSTEWSQL